MPIQSYKCGGCEKVRAENRFSKTTISKYQQSLAAFKRNNNATIKLPRCSDCSGAPVHELKCSHCDVVKGLDSFSKAMRKDPDNARCWDCSQAQQDLEAHHKDQVQEEITMDRIRVGASLTNFGAGSTALGYGASSRAMGQSYGVSASTDIDGASDWINPQIPIPDDPRAQAMSHASHRRSPSNISSDTHVSSASAITGTGWENFERTNAPYREQVVARRSGSNSNVSHSGSNHGFVKAGAVKQDPHVKAHISLARQQRREYDQAEQATLNASDSDDDDDDDPY